MGGGCHRNTHFQPLGGSVFLDHGDGLIWHGLPCASRIIGRFDQNRDINRIPIALKQQFPSTCLTRKSDAHTIRLPGIGSYSILDQVLQSVGIRIEIFLGTATIELARRKLCGQPPAPRRLRSDRCHTRSATDDTILGHAKIDAESAQYIVQRCTEKRNRDRLTDLSRGEDQGSAARGKMNSRESRAF